MAITKPEWFRIDPAKFLSDVTVDSMTTVELGSCFRLLCRQWLDGYIPDDLAVLARLCRLDADAMRTAWQTLSAFFPVVEQGKRANRFMFIERERVVAEIEKRSDAGTKAARKRWDAKCNAGACGSHTTGNASGIAGAMQESESESESEKSFSSELKGSSDTPPRSSQKPQPKLVSEQGAQLGSLLKAEILRNKPDARITPSQERAWAEEADRILKLDKRDFAEACRVVRWAQSDSFWLKNVLSMDKLRKQYDKLVLEMRSKLQPGIATAPLPMASAAELMRRSREVTQ